MISLEKVLSAQNMLLACKRVRVNKGALGVDGMTVDELEGHFRRHWASICAHIREGRYIPSPVKRVDIPKPDGGTRMLGIPTVQDRLIQQAIAEVLVEHFDPTFSEFSYGFRPGRSAHQAIEQTQRYIAEGCSWIVEMDLAKFFDTVNHDRLISVLERNCRDKMLIRLIRRYLRTGILADGLVTPRDEGTPQGSPLSPILSLIVLDELDKYLEKRGLKFCRYADDCNIYVASERAGNRVLTNTIKFIEETLKLRVNRDKSGVFRPRRAKFLGYTFVGKTGQPLVHPKSFKRLQDKPRTVFYRARGGSLFRTIRVLNAILRGWRQYFKLDTRKGGAKRSTYTSDAIFVSWCGLHGNDREHANENFNVAAWMTFARGSPPTTGVERGGMPTHATCATRSRCLSSNNTDSTASSRCAESPSTTNSETAGCRTARPNAQH